MEVGSSDKEKVNGCGKGCIVLVAHIHAVAGRISCTMPVLLAEHYPSVISSDCRYNERDDDCIELHCSLSRKTTHWSRVHSKGSEYLLPRPKCF